MSEFKIILKPVEEDNMFSNEIINMLKESVNLF